MPPPDPSQPDQMQQMIQQTVYRILADPLQYPDEMTNWLTTFISLNSPIPAVASASAAK